MQWIAFFVILGVAILVFPRLLKAAKSNTKGSFGGAAMALGMAFSTLLDPAKKASIENLQKKKETGEANAEAAGETVGPIVVAVDGPTASGKGTIAKALAAHFGLPMLDTGLLYRAVGYQVLQQGGNPDDASDALKGCDFPDALLADDALRSEAVGGLASRVSVHPAVRAALKARQVDFANQPGGALLDGRDIGTVIAPDADVKLFVTAPAEVRARRRYDEMVSRGADVTFEAILADIHARDERDSSRAVAPLKPAADAILLDTGNLTIGGAVRKAIELVNTEIENRSR